MKKFKLRLAECFTILCLVTLVTKIASGQTLRDPTVSSDDNFGIAVAINDDIVVVSASGDDTEDSNVGQVHLFDRDTLALLQTIDDPTESTQDNFGGALAVSGNMLVIAAPQDSSQALLVGQAHLYDVTTQTFIHTFDDPAPTSADFFGTSVAIAGNDVVVGSPGDDTLGLGVGQVHVFDAVSGSLRYTLDDPTPAPFDGFGQAVSISSNLIAVGDPGDDTDGFGVGQVHLFAADTGMFLRTISDPDRTSSDSFGFSVAVSGDLIAVGAPTDDSLGTDVGAAHLFNSNTGDLIHTLPSPNLTQEGRFGFSLVLDGDVVIIGAPGMVVGGDSTGAAYRFDANTGQVVMAFNNETADSEDEFGSALALSGAALVIGSPSNDDDGENVGITLLCGVEPAQADCVTVLGDINLDGAVDLLDVGPFVELLGSSSFQLEGDVNLDGIFDLLDVGTFVDILTGQ